MKPLAEIADEYERNLSRLVEYRDELRDRVASAPSHEQRRKLQRQVWMVESMIYESSRAIGIMRGEIHG